MSRIRATIHTNPPISLTVDLKEYERNGLRGWEVVCTLPAGVVLPAGSSYQITLADGRAGKIGLTNLNHSSGQAAVAYFKGNGPLVVP